MPSNRSLFRAATLGTALGLLLTLMTAAFAQSGPGRIDHVRILVNDVKTTGRDIYGKRLGFYLPEQEPAIFDEGSAHEGIVLFDHTYLELVGVADADKLRCVRPWIVNFLQSHEGAHSVGLAVDSAEQMADRLSSQGIDAPMFRLTPSAGAKPIVLITPRMPHLPEGTFFFLQYPESWWREHPPHQQFNSTVGIAAVWMLVKDLNEAGKDAEILGFRRGRSLQSDILEAQGMEFNSETGKIILLRPSTTGGPAARFANDRGEGLMGVSLVASDLANARGLIEGNTKRMLAVYQGFYGKSFLVPAELASGVWIEIVQK